jgi:hypothetical protein
VNPQADMLPILLQVQLAVFAEKYRELVCFRWEERKEPTSYMLKRRFVLTNRGTSVAEARDLGVELLSPQTPQLPVRRSDPVEVELTVSLKALVALSERELRDLVLNFGGEAVKRAIEQLREPT